MRDKRCHSLLRQGIHAAASLGFQIKDNTTAKVCGGMDTPPARGMTLALGGGQAHVAASRLRSR